MADIFLSYDSDDRERVRSLVEQIESKGFSIWWDRQIGIGSSFDREIETQLESAKSVIVVWTRHSIDSDWVRSEAYDGLERGVLIPVLLDDVKPPLAFRQTQTANLIGWPNNKDDFTNLILAIRSTLATAAHNRTELSSVTQQVRSRITEHAIYEAFVLARNLVKEAPADHDIHEILADITRSMDIVSSPSGATVRFRAYGTGDTDWINLGQTPILDCRLPGGPSEWLFEKKDYIPVTRAVILTRARHMGDSMLAIELDPIGEMPADMARVDGGETSLYLTGYSQSFSLNSYFVDIHEVTNEKFQKFVDAGGYTKPEFWSTVSFYQQKKEISWETAMLKFLDTTGHCGPGDWELGHYPSGRGSYPVNGISWYEAAAYSQFCGRSLPTVFHWARMALNDLNPLVIPRSNLNGKNIAEVGEFDGKGVYGTYDTAGNVREWCWNADEDNHWILGGSWHDPDYVYVSPSTASSWDRSLSNGFRTVKYLSEDADSIFANFKLRRIDPNERKPVSDKIYAGYVKQFQHPLKPVKKVDVTQEQWLRRGWQVDRIEITMGSGERLPIVVFRPLGATRPLQGVIYFSGNIPFTSPVGTRDTLEPNTDCDWVINSGRALIIPIWKGSFERQDNFLNQPEPLYSQGLRIRFVEWHHEMATAIDVLIDHGIIAANKIGFLGTSFGGCHALLLAALEPRISTAIVIGAGIGFRLMPQEVDQVNYLPRITIPVLMLNGEYDEMLSKVYAQEPMFKLLGAAPEHKRHVCFEAGHSDFPRGPMLREAVGWLDKYLGVVDKS